MKDDRTTLVDVAMAPTLKQFSAAGTDFALP
jgi:hypothetical protein